MHLPNILNDELRATIYFEKHGLIYMYVCILKSLTLGNKAILIKISSVSLIKQ